MATLTVLTAGGFAAGTALLSVFTATMAPNVALAIFAGAFIGSVIIGGIGMAIGGLSTGNEWDCDNAASGFALGTILGAIIGGAWGGIHYGLQRVGLMQVKIEVNKLVQDPINVRSDEAINYWTKTLAQNKWKNYNKLPGQNGIVEKITINRKTMMINNGHHRIEVLKKYVENLKYIYVYF